MLDRLSVISVKTLVKVAGFCDVNYKTKSAQL